MRRADVVLFTGSPPLMLHFIAPLNLLLRKRLIYRITDFHPECLIAERGGGGLMLRLAAPSHAFLAPPGRRIRSAGLRSGSATSISGIAGRTDSPEARSLSGDIRPGLTPLPLPDELRDAVPELSFIRATGA